MTTFVIPQLAPIYAALGPWVEALLRVVVALCLIPHGLRHISACSPTPACR